MSLSPSPVGLGCSSAHFVQCGPAEPNWTWTQIWAHARMPDYSLNWTARSSTIQGWQRCQWCNYPIRKGAQPKPESFGFKSAIENWLFGTEVRKSAEKPLHEAVTNRSPSLGGIFVSASHLTGLDLRSMSHRSIIVGVWVRWRSGTSRSLSPARLYWSSGHLVQCGSDEPIWTWTQIWAHAPMPDYNLNWTGRSSAI